MTPSGEEAPVFELHRCADMHPAECWQGCSRDGGEPGTGSTVTVASDDSAPDVTVAVHRAGAVSPEDTMR